MQGGVKNVQETASENQHCLLCTAASPSLKLHFTFHVDSLQYQLTEKPAISSAFQLITSFTSRPAILIRQHCRSSSTESSIFQLCLQNGSSSLRNHRFRKLLFQELSSTKPASPLLYDTDTHTQFSVMIWNDNATCKPSL